MIIPAGSGRDFTCLAITHWVRRRDVGAGQKEMENEEEERIGPGSSLQHGPGYPCGPMTEGGGGQRAVEDEAGSYAVAIIVFPDEPSDEAPADPGRLWKD